MVIPGISEPAIPYGSLVVVSGACGFIGSHIVDQALAVGFKVRGTTRSVERSSWARKYFHGKYGPQNFDLIEVPDMAAEGAFDTAVVDAAGFIHVANDMTGSMDPNIAVPRAVNGVLNALEACAKGPLIRRFVYTSSSFAVTQPKPGVRFTVTTDTFNEEAVKRAWEANPDSATVYSCSKVEAERAITQWVAEHRPSFVVNTVQPNANIGTVLSPASQGYPTSARWVKALWESDYESLKNNGPEHYVDVQDDARLHVIGLADPTVQDERLFAVAGPTSMPDIISILRKNFPHKRWEDFPDERRDLCIYEPTKRADELLRRSYGQGFRSLEQSVLDNTTGLV
ncbi:aldehyde reductase [Ilyonectria sp. MPI-CAGE-AT-0026]|nr:aldehyde reductase [Ilyonectria sp. MPI-CAGE-AT-0026]